MILCNALIFLLGCTAFGFGIWINQRFQGWHLATVSILGWICVCAGFFLVLLALLGMCAVRSDNVKLIFLYFVLLMLLIATLGLSCVIALGENEKIGGYLCARALHPPPHPIAHACVASSKCSQCCRPARSTIVRTRNWAVISARLGLDALADMADGDRQNDGLTLEGAIQLVNDCFYAVVGVTGGTLVVLATALGATMQILGVRAIAMSLLTSLGILGFAVLGIAWATYPRVPFATTVLLTICSGVQIACCVTGLLGFHWLNRECTCCSLTVLLIAAAGLSYAAVATYYWLRDTTPIHPENLLLVFAICCVADFFIVGTLVFVSILYFCHRRAFFEAEKVAELGVDFSDYDQRVRERRRENKGKRAKEFVAHESL